MPAIATLIEFALATLGDTAQTGSKVNSFNPNYCCATEETKSSKTFFAFINILK
jgi:hypothetical protein